MSEKISGLATEVRIKRNCDMCQCPLFKSGYIVTSQKIKLEDSDVVTDGPSSKIVVCDGCWAQEINGKTKRY